MRGATVLGICVGGQGRRMGRVQKALLPAPASPDGPAGETLLARLVRLARAVELEVVLLGHADLGDIARKLPQLPDAEPGSGPLGGLASLLEYTCDGSALCLACDLPFVTAPLLVRLRDEAPGASILAPRDPETGKWQALFARYSSNAVAPLLSSAVAGGDRSFQALFRRVSVTEMPLDAHERELLRDWDTPEDMRAT